MLVTCVLHIRLEGQGESRNEVGSLSPVERLVGFEPTIFWSQHVNPLGYSYQNDTKIIFSFCLSFVSLFLAILISIFKDLRILDIFDVKCWGLWC